VRCVFSAGDKGICEKRRDDGGENKERHKWLGADFQKGAFQTEEIAEMMFKIAITLYLMRRNYP